MADGDKSILADSKIMLLGAANRDPGRYPAPGRLDLARRLTELSMTLVK
jgi:cytochrome P450